MTGATGYIATPAIPVPGTLAEALDRAWLETALKCVAGGARIEEVETVEILRTVATKARFSIRFSDRANPSHFCLKGFLDVDELTARGGSTMVREADFYTEVAPSVAVRVPDCIAAIVDRDRQQAIIIMRDLIAEGATFCSALEPFTAEEAASSLEQIARLHAGSKLLRDMPWISPRVAELARARYVSAEQLQSMLDGPRGEGLSSAVRDADRLIAAVQELASRDEARPRFLVHGDSHAGNLYRTAEGVGLIDWQLLQRGGWALDVAYHIAAVLPVETSQHEEQRLLRHYLDTMRGLGCEVPDPDEAWTQYREALIYGYYLWAITRRVDPEITNLFVNRLGSAVERHESHGLLGIS